ncbi:MAG: beta-lactamase family protein [Ignavibacteria bacterium]|jgi:CubicO group peptidase (beta-lactamase class C family)|nr:beta-lactamase family protein [Ignavibacteria bacterium]MDH7527608.1 serine hydrolase [Ignavibacteria bacterium]
MKKILALVLFFISTSFAQYPSLISPEEIGLSSERLKYIDSVVIKNINEGNLPGAVILIGNNNGVVYRKAFGNSWLVPEKKPMKIETIFDLASLTKPIATATSIMILVERGVISLEDEVRKYIPEFKPFVDENGKEHYAKIYHLLTHTSGLPDYTNADSIKNKYGYPAPEGTIETICNLPRFAPPGKEFKYSCLGFITLAEIIKRVTGKNIAEFSKENIFVPLGMKKTTYNPDENLKKDCAPTEIRDGKILCGEVHDPLANVQGGISGNAGLFSTGDDLAIFAQMILNKGIYKGKRILGSKTVELMTSIYPKVEFAGRGLGWDINSAYMQQRGDIFEIGSFGHTGFTGTSIHISKKENIFLIILTNRVHPDGKGNVASLRRAIANIVASAIVK